MGRLGLFRCQTAGTCDEYARTAWSRKKGHVRQKLDPSGAAARKLTLAPPASECPSVSAAIKSLSSGRRAALPSN